MEGNWTYLDLIDLEYCLSLDTEHQHADLHERDRQIFLSTPETVKKDGRDRIIRHWLESRRKSLFDGAAAKSPGTVGVDSYRSFSYLLIIFGVILGFAAGLSFLAYSGTTPVNVLNFLFLFIFSQLLVMAVIIPAAGLRMAGVSAIPAPIASLYAMLMNRFSLYSARLNSHIPAEKRSAYNQVAGIWKKQHSRYRQTLYWPLFSLSQYTMFGINFGLLAATVYRVITSDIAFGWQSTIQFSVQFIHKTVSLLALPWSWIVPAGYAYPSESEIEGSRIILKDGIYHLATQDLVSWWPFLVFCIVVYGLLFRFFLILLGRLGRQRSLRKLQLDTPALLQLVQRMQSPLMTSQAVVDQVIGSQVIGGQVVVSHPDNTEDAIRKASAVTPTDRQERSDHALYTTILLIPEEMTEHYDRAVIDAYLQNSGFTVTDHRVFMAGYEADRDVIGELAATDWPPDTGIAAIAEAWMPPINETVSFFKDLRAAVGPSIPIWIVLSGRPDDNGSPARPTQNDRLVWQRKIDELADPYTDLIDLTDRNNT